MRRTRVAPPAEPLTEPAPEPTPPLPGRLGQELVRAGLASLEEIEAAIFEAHRTHHRLGEVLIETGILEERDVYRMLAAIQSLPFRSSEDLLVEIDPTLARAVSQRFQEYVYVDGWSCSQFKGSDLVFPLGANGTFSPGATVCL